MMALILGFFFVGITFINYWYGIVPEKEVTVLSQIGKAVFGHGILYYVLQFATALILAVAANKVFLLFQFLHTIWQKINSCPTCIKIVGID